MTGTAHRWLFAAALVLLTIGLTRDGLDNWIARTKLPPLVHAVSFEVQDRDGALLRVFPVENGRWRLATTPADVDPLYLDLLIQTEDRRFFQHRGVDLRALMRATGQAVRHGRIVSGGSTLTMQTARLLENSGTGHWSGKLRQIRVALALERRLSKDQILSLYLTHAPFGGNLEGVRAAAFAWLGKPARRLSPADAALLVALPQAPETRRPDRHSATANTARNRILQRAGLDETSEPLPATQHPMPRRAPHLAEHAQQQATAGTSVARLSIDRHLQPRIADLARRAVQDLPKGVSAAIVIADHQSGAILAYVGASDYGDARNAGFVDMVRAPRSPGSTLKPLIYALAFDEGLAHPQTLISDQPTAFGAYSPQNFDGLYRGDVTATQALQLSLNIPPVKLTEALGPHRLMAALRRAGAEPDLPGAVPGLAVALGGVGLSLHDLVQLYAGLARGGRAISLSWTANTRTDPSATLVSRSAAWQVQSILAGIQPPQGQPLGRVAFKTGTSYGHRDAWAVGWDGQHVIGVWLGRPDGTPVPGIFGGEVAAPILFEAFERIAPTRAPLSAPPPETLIQPNALLPKALQRFDHRRTDQPKDALRVAFPPNGARLRRTGLDTLVVKLEGGTPPFTLMTNGIATPPDRAREIAAPLPGPGFTTLRAIDSIGRTHQVQIQLD